MDSIIKRQEEKIAVGFNEDWSVRYMTRGELMDKYPEIYALAAEGLIEQKQ